MCPDLRGVMAFKRKKVATLKGKQQKSNRRRNAANDLNLDKPASSRYVPQQMKSQMHISRLPARMIPLNIQQGVLLSCCIADGSRWPLLSWMRAYSPGAKVLKHPIEQRYILNPRISIIRIGERPGV